jgi:hypothetical protein
MNQLWWTLLGLLLVSCASSTEPDCLRSDAGEYPDECDHLLWANAGNETGHVYIDEEIGQVYVESMTLEEWMNVKHTADIRLWMRVGALRSTRAVAPGSFDASTMKFSPILDVFDIAATDTPVAARGAKYMTESEYSTGPLWAEPRVDSVVLRGSGLRAFDELYGHRITHFVRTITGFGYDSRVGKVGIRGYWEVRGY